MTPAQLRLLGVSEDRAEAFAGPITDTMVEYDISTKERQAAFVAQILHESGLLRYTSEIWGPTPAQSRYEGRADLGNNQPGDGSKYRGRGNPEWLSRPTLAARSAGWFWKVHGCNEIADSGDFTRLTRRINGGINGLEDRERLWHIARRIFE